MQQFEIVLFFVFQYLIFTKHENILFYKIQFVKIYFASVLLDFCELDRALYDEYRM